MNNYFFKIPTHKEVVKRDLDHAIADLHHQKAVLEMSQAMVFMLEKRVARLEVEAKH